MLRAQDPTETNKKKRLEEVQIIQVVQKEGERRYVEGL